MGTQDVPVDWDGEMQSFIEYVSRFEASFADCIRGADVADINEVEKLAGEPLPPEYRAFLAIMGRTETNAIGRFLEETEFNITAAREFYTDPDRLRPPHAIFLWTVDVDYTLFLSTIPERPLGQPVIHVTWTLDDEIDSIVEMHDSLLELLYGKAFGIIRQPRLAYHGEFTARRGEWDEASSGTRDAAFRRLSQQLGFVAVPYMGKRWICRERDDAALSYYQPEGFDTPVIELSAAEEMEFGRLSELIDDHLAMWRRA